MTLVTHIAIVGHHKEKVIDSIRRFPVGRVLLLVARGERDLIERAREIEREIRGVEVEIVEVERENFFESVEKIIELINREKDMNHEVKLNIADSSDNLGVACYIAALVTEAEIYSAVSRIEDGRVTGVSDVYSIPLFPIKDVGGERIRILKILYESEINSMDEMIRRLNPDVKEEKILGERARISYRRIKMPYRRIKMLYHIKILKNEGFVEGGRAGKSVRLRITKLGEIYLKGKRIV